MVKYYRNFLCLNNLIPSNYGAIPGSGSEVPNYESRKWIMKIISDPTGSGSTQRLIFTAKQGSRVGRYLPTVRLSRAWIQNRYLLLPTAPTVWFVMLTIVHMVPMVWYGVLWYGLVWKYGTLRCKYEKALYGTVPVPYR